MGEFTGHGGDSRSLPIEVSDTCEAALRAATAEDWDQRAGQLDWSVRATVAHMVDVLGFYALHLASGSPVRLRVDIRPHDGATSSEMLDTLHAAAWLLGLIVGVSPGQVRAWHLFGPSDPPGFAAMACDELLIHTYDVMAGLGRQFAASEALVWPILHRLFPDAPTDVIPGSCCCGPTGVSGWPGSQSAARTGPGRASLTCDSSRRAQVPGRRTQQLTEGSPSGHESPARSRERQVSRFRGERQEDASDQIRAPDH
jgi:hypothetical protein